jgi:FtsH-binding integral membrane protein
MTQSMGLEHSPVTFEQSKENALERVERSRQQHELILKTLSTLGFGAIWGLAAGSAVPSLALANVYKVPMVIALSVVVALPGVLVARRLLDLEVSVQALCAAIVTSLHRATLVLLGFAPLLGVYAYTSQWVAPLLAQGSALLALLCGAFALRRELGKLEAPRRQLLVLGFVTIVALGLSLLQLITLATPVLTLPTAFGHGIDGVLR